MGQVGCRAVAQAVFPTGQAAHLAGAIGTVHIRRAQRMHKTIGPITVERGHAERHAQCTGAMRIHNPCKARRNLGKRLIPTHSIESRAVLAAAHGMQDTVALVKRHGQAMPPAGAQGARGARMSRHRQLGRHAAILNMGRKGAIGIASPARGHNGATGTLSIRCHLDYPFPNQTQRPTGPQQAQGKISLPHGNAPRKAQYTASSPLYASDFLA